MLQFQALLLTQVLLLLEVTTLYTHVMNDFLRLIFHFKNKGFSLWDMFLKTRSVTYFWA